LQAISYGHPVCIDSFEVLEFSMYVYNFTIVILQGNVSVSDMVWVSVMQEIVTPTTTNMDTIITTTSGNSSFFES
jgi:hypothetical protein